MAMTAGDSGGAGAARTLGPRESSGPIPFQGTIKKPATLGPRESSGPYPVISQIKQPVAAPTQLAQPWQGPNVGTVPWQGSQDYNQQQAAINEPIAPPAGPRAGGREEYNQMDAGGQAAADAAYLAGDSDYTAQVAEYDRALQSFVDRIANQRKMFQEDADLATASTGRNQEMSLNNLGEDFGARGLSYSGMFDTTKNETNQRFNDAKGGIERIRSKNDTEAVNRETDYRAENAISKSNASRASLGRQAQRQALIDSGGF